MANSRLCSIPECGKTHEAKGLCRKHYLRMCKHGDPLAGGTSPGEAKEFYETVVLPYEGNECLFWPYNRRNNGYGYISKDGQNTSVSRLVCEEQNGPPPTPEHEAAHGCGKGHLGCVSKQHLEWKTPKENQADRIIHDTHKRGERNHLTKLTEAQVREILSLKGVETQESIAKRFGVAFQHISKIHRGETWSWLQP